MPTIVATKKRYSIGQLSLTELIGIDDKIDQNDYSGTVDLLFGSEASGKILGITLVSTETGTGAVQVPLSELYVLSADPATVPGDTALSAAERKTLVGQVDIAVADWVGDAAISMHVYKSVEIPFHSLNGLYFVLRNKDAAGINDVGADDEIIEINVWYERST